MLKIKKEKRIDANSIILNGMEHFDYFDVFSKEININTTPDEVINSMFRLPKWVYALLHIRNFIVWPLGLKSDVNKSPERVHYNKGSNAIFFMVLDRTEDEIIFADNDKHLNFRLSIFTKKQTDSKRLYVTTIVKYNNLLGKIYFFFIKPFHILIIKRLLLKI